MPRTTSKNGADPSGEGTRRLDEVGPLELRPTGHPEGSMDRIRVSMDPAGNARTAVGPTVRGEYERAGCRGRNGLESWPVSPKADGLQLVEALLKSADGSVNLTIHPRCRRVITALRCDTRARRADQ